jgi:dephospho-CoA kinase
MKVVGITGGIGSGKSTISDILKDNYRAHLISTDAVAHDLMKKDMICYKKIVEYFGIHILDSNGEIDRKKLASIVYNDKDELLKLNSFTHPYVMDYVKNLIVQKQKVGISLICVETALPVEAGLKDFCDEIWYVYALEDIRKQRLIENRQYPEKKIEEILKNQISDEDYRKASTQIIENNCSKEKIIEQIEALLEK